MATYLNDTKARSSGAMKDRKFLFAGNRRFVLDEMDARGLDADILAVAGSHLERGLHEAERPHAVIRNKEDLIARLESMEYDIFVANGCPYILPVSRLQRPGRIFVNVHPGPLPDLRGMDPVPGALLMGRESGAACHLMDDGVDTGPLISRVVVPNTNDLDAGLLYQISFLAERQAFGIACDRGFQPALNLAPGGAGIYYSRKPRDLMIDFAEPAEAIIRRVKAFSNRSQGARFSFQGMEFRVFDAERVLNPYLMERRDSYKEGEVVFRYEDCLLLRKGEAFLKFKAIEGDLSVIRPGDVLGQTSVASPPREKAPVS